MAIRESQKSQTMANAVFADRPDKVNSRSPVMAAVARRRLARRSPVLNSSTQLESTHTRTPATVTTVDSIPQRASPAAARNVRHAAHQTLKRSTGERQPRAHAGAIRAAGRKPAKWALGEGRRVGRREGRTGVGRDKTNTTIHKTVAIPKEQDYLMRPHRANLLNTQNRPRRGGKSTHRPPLTVP